MSKKKYTIGVDYGTESGRAVLVDVATGEEVATAVHPYGDGVIDEHLPGSDEPLPPVGWNVIRCRPLSPWLSPRAIARIIFLWVSFSIGLSPPRIQITCASL